MQAQYGGRVEELQGMAGQWAEELRRAQRERKRYEWSPVAVPFDLQFGESIGVG